MFEPNPNPHKQIEKSLLQRLETLNVSILEEKKLLLDLEQNTGSEDSHFAIESLRSKIAQKEKEIAHISEQLKTIAEEKRKLANRLHLTEVVTEGPLKPGEVSLLSQWKAYPLGEDKDSKDYFEADETWLDEIKTDLESGKPQSSFRRMYELLLGGGLQPRFEHTWKALHINGKPAERTSRSSIRNTLSGLNKLLRESPNKTLATTSKESDGTHTTSLLTKSPLDSDAFSIESYKETVSKKLYGGAGFEFRAEIMCLAPAINFATYVQQIVPKLSEPSLNILKKFEIQPKYDISIGSDFPAVTDLSPEIMFKQTMFTGVLLFTPIGFYIDASSLATILDQHPEIVNDLKTCGIYLNDVNGIYKYKTNSGGKLEFDDAGLKKKHVYCLQTREHISSKEIAEVAKYLRALDLTNFGLLNS